MKRYKRKFKENVYSDVKIVLDKAMTIFMDKMVLSDDDEYGFDDAENDVAENFGRHLPLLIKDSLKDYLDKNADDLDKGLGLDGTKALNLCMKALKNGIK